MSNNQGAIPAPEEQQKPKKLGPCCVCKVTKKLRDECFLFKSEEECKTEIANHNQCLRDNGFEVPT